MTPLVLVLAGLVALVAAVLVLRSFGTGYRIGRLLAATPVVDVETAVAAAARGAQRYVRIAGRIDAETEFEDEHHRPLVFRRQRLEVRRDGRWEAVHDSRETVPFEVREGFASIDIDSDALDEGLVVIPREAIGTASEARDHVPADVPDETAVRMRVEQVSSVEHAVVLGVPIMTAAGRPAMTAGAGRPLVLTTLEPAEAMRLLAGGRRARPILASALLASGTSAVLAGGTWALLAGLR